MPDSVTVQLKNDKNIVEAFRGLREDLPGKILRASVRDAASYLLGIIQSFAPVRTGRLLRNISLRTHQTASTTRARIAINTIGKADNEQNAFYWRFLEKGWHDRAGTAHQQPFVAPAVIPNETEAAQIVIDSVGEAIDRAEAKAR